MSHHFFTMLSHTVGAFHLSLSDPAGKTNRLGNVVCYAPWLSTHCFQLRLLTDFCLRSFYHFDSSITNSTISQHAERQCRTGNLPAAVWPHFNLWHPDITEPGSLLFWVFTCSEYQMSVVYCILYIRWVLRHKKKWTPLVSFEVFSNDCINFMALNGLNGGLS